MLVSWDPLHVTSFNLSGPREEERGKCSKLHLNETESRGLDLKTRDIEILSVMRK